MLHLLLLTPIKNDFAPRAITLGVAIAILAREELLHSALDALHSLALMVQEAQHMAEHGAIRVGADRVHLGVNSAQIPLAHFGLEFQNNFVGNLALQDEIFSTASDFFRDLFFFESEVTRDEF